MDPEAQFWKIKYLELYIHSATVIGQLARSGGVQPMPIPAANGGAPATAETDTKNAAQQQ